MTAWCLLRSYGSITVCSNRALVPSWLVVTMAIRFEMPLMKITAEIWLEYDRIGSSRQNLTNQLALEKLHAITFIGYMLNFWSASATAVSHDSNCPKVRKLWMIQMRWLRWKVIVAIGRFPLCILSVCGLLATLSGWPIQPPQNHSSKNMTRRINTQNERPLREKAIQFWDALQGSNVSHVRKRKIVFQSPLVGDMSDMLVPGGSIRLFLLHYIIMQPSFQEMCGPPNWWLEPRTCGWNLKEEDTNLVVRVQGFPFVSLERLVIFLYLEWQGQPPPQKKHQLGPIGIKFTIFWPKKIIQCLDFKPMGSMGLVYLLSQM